MSLDSIHHIMQLANVNDLNHYGIEAKTLASDLTCLRT